MRLTKQRKQLVAIIGIILLLALTFDSFFESPLWYVAAVLFSGIGNEMLKRGETYSDPPPSSQPKKRSSEKEDPSYGNSNALLMMYIASASERQARLGQEVNNAKAERVPALRRTSPINLEPEDGDELERAEEPEGIQLPDSSSINVDELWEV